MPQRLMRTHLEAGGRAIQHPSPDPLQTPQIPRPEGQGRELVSSNVRATLAFRE